MRTLSSRYCFRPTSADPALCAQLFGEHIEIARRTTDRLVEELAPRACLTVEEWLAIEAGQTPDAVEQVLLMVVALGLGPRWKAYVMRLWVGSQRKQP